MANKYVALVRKDADSDFGVEFPDLPGCITVGRGLDEALAFAEEALAGHLRFLAAEGEAIPAPSSLEEVMADPDNAGTVMVLVPAPPSRGRSVPVNITMDEFLLAEIDRAAGKRGRSRFLAEAARKVLASARSS